MAEALLLHPLPGPKLAGAVKRRPRSEATATVMVLAPSHKPDGSFAKGNQVGFKPGKSGNPGGIPKGYKPVSKAIKRWLSLPTGELDPETGEPLVVADEIARKLVDAAKSGLGSMAATDLIIRTTEGTKIQVEADIAIGSLGALPVDELLERRRKLLAKKEGDE